MRVGMRRRRAYVSTSTTRRRRSSYGCHVLTFGPEQRHQAEHEFDTVPDDQHPRARAVRLLFRRYAVTWLYLGLYSLCAVICKFFLGARDRAELIAWSSTNLVNLRHNPAGSLVASAFMPLPPSIAWLVLGSLGLFTVNRLLGNVRTVLLLITGHVAGTLVSEGIVGYQVSHAILPSSARHIADVGPSLVVMCALATATLYGSRMQRVAAGAGLAVLAIQIFRDGYYLDLTAVASHLTTLATGAVLGGLLLLSARRVDRDEGRRQQHCLLNAREAAQEGQPPTRLRFRPAARSRMSPPQRSAPSASCRSARGSDLRNSRGRAPRPPHWV